MTLTWTRDKDRTDWHAYVGRVRVGIVIRGSDGYYRIGADSEVLDGKFERLCDARAALVGALNA